MVSVSAKTNAPCGVPGHIHEPDDNLARCREPRPRSVSPAPIDTSISIALGINSGEWERIGPQARRIIEEILPTFIAKFVAANLHYGPNNANVLGQAGQFADMWRKMGPLRRALWEGETLTREGPDDICMDLIGHCLLTIDMIQQGVDRRGTGPIS